MLHCLKTLTAVKLVLARHDASRVVAVLGTVAKPLSEVPVVRAGVIALVGVVVRVNGERVLTALGLGNADTAGGTLPEADRTVCTCNIKHLHAHTESGESMHKT